LSTQGGEGRKSIKRGRGGPQGVGIAPSPRKTRNDGKDDQGGSRESLKFNRTKEKKKGRLADALGGDTASATKRRARFQWKKDLGS